MLYFKYIFTKLKNEVSQAGAKVSFLHEKFGSNYI
jgi:hypothetical protein